jgi:hypothetical protein
VRSLLSSARSVRRKLALRAGRVTRVLPKSRFVELFVSWNAVRPLRTREAPSVEGLHMAAELG